MPEELDVSQLRLHRETEAKRDSIAEQWHRIRCFAEVKFQAGEK
jgi:hypothetical protein